MKSIPGELELCRTSLPRNIPKPLRMLMERSEKKWDAYRFKDTGITFSKDYILPGEELTIIFQSGKLNGMVFAVTFDPDGKDEQLWEIVETRITVAVTR